jgi:hypothetical protein
VYLRGGAHRFADARHFVIENGGRRLRRTIARSEARAAARQDERHAVPVAELDQLGLERGRFVG